MNRPPARLWDFPSAAFLFLVLLTASQRLFSTHWARGLETGTILAMSGIVLGLALGLSRFKPKAVFWFSLGYSLSILILVLGAILFSGISWLDRLVHLSDHLAHSFGLFITNQPVIDTLLFVVFMALVFWIIGLMAGYAMTRYGNIIGAVVPAGVAFVIIQVYDPARAGSDTNLAVFFALCLLFLGRLTYVQRRLFWKESRVSIWAESKTDLNITLIVVAIAAVLLVWLAPTSVKSLTNIKTAWEDLTRPLRDVQNDLGHATAGLQGGGSVASIQFFGDPLPLGNQAATGDTEYLQIQVPTPNSNDTGRYYWRVRSYNIYLNDQWYAENVSNEPFKPDQVPISLADPEGSTDSFAFTPLSESLTTLVTPARPVWVSYPSELLFLQVAKDKMDPVQFQPNPPVLKGEQYFVRADVNEPTIVQLRSAGKTYPDWVIGHYLQLPDNLPPKVAALSKKITANAKTPYDMAAAITEYLRNNIKYSTTFKDPPAGQDPLDWFLFDSKSGFCNYYATAEVIMLRTLGIPARMVVGFAQGQFEAPDEYVVRQGDSHAWPEVYFPNVGWVEFEPTVSQTALARPLEASSTSSDQSGHELPFRPITSGRNIPEGAGDLGTGQGQATSNNLILRLIFLWLIGITALQLHSFGAFDNFFGAVQQAWGKSLPSLLNQFIEKRGLTPPAWLLHWASLAEMDPIDRSYMTVYRSLHWLGEKAAPAQTPAEAAEVLSGYLPDFKAEIHTLLLEYQHHFYSQKHGSLLVARRTVKIIRREAMRLAIQQRWTAFRGIFRPGSEQTGIK